MAAEQQASERVQLQQLPDFINDVVYTAGTYPCLIDESGLALMFLKYRSRVHSVLCRGDMEPERLRVGLTQCLHSGGWLCIDFDSLDYDVEAIFGQTTFPLEVLSPQAIFLEETYRPLLRDADEFAPRVLYESLSNVQAPGAFQDRTKAHAPERVADVNKNFDPQESFRLMFVCKKQPPGFLRGRVGIYEVSTTGVKQEKAVWGGGEPPKPQREPALVKLDTEFLESAFEGDIDGVKKCLQQGADPYAVDGRGSSALSEAAVEGHCAVARLLLDEHQLTDLNGQNHEGRTALHRAAFQSRLEMIQLLLEAGADPRIKTKSFELPFDIASSDEARQLLKDWDVSRTDALLAERQKVVEAAQESMVKNEEERRRLQRARQFAKMEQLIEDGNKEELELALLDLQPGEVNTLRDGKGNALLHVAASKHKPEICIYLVEEAKAQVDSRDAKGWTALMVAALAGAKRVCIELLARGANPALENAYRKTALDLAKTDEVKEILQQAANSTGPVAVTPATAETSSASAGGGVSSAAAPKAKAGAPSAKPRAKSKGRAKSVPKSAAKSKAKARA